MKTYPEIGEKGYMVKHRDPLSVIAKWFTWDEIRCKHCGKYPGPALTDRMHFVHLMGLADSIRGHVGKPINVNSGFRCPDHPIEKAKREPGAHAFMLALDLKLHGRDVYRAVRCVTRHSLNENLGIGIGLFQSGPIPGRYLHIDVAGIYPRWHDVRPWIWTYPS